VADQDRTWLRDMSEAYERWLVPTLFRPYASDLAARAAAHRPERVLELAAGTGAVTRLLVEELDAEIVATDLNQGMVEVGRQRAPGADWRQADAQALPFDDESFDLVVCQFGVMFFPDKRAAFAEVRRVLRPGGRFLFNSWADLAANDHAAALSAALDGLFPDDPPRFVAAVPHGYHDPDAITADLESAGFQHVHHVTVTLAGTAASADDLARGFCTGSPLRAELAARGDVDALTERVSAALTASLGDGPVTGAMSAHVVEAVKEPRSGS
jgi:SAM-dependent methyltransferase